MGEETSVHIIGPFYSTQSAQRRLRAMVAGPLAPPHGAPFPTGPVPAPPLLPNGGGTSHAAPASEETPAPL